MIATAALLNPAKMIFIKLLSSFGINSPNKSKAIDAGVLKYKKAINPPRQLCVKFVPIAITICVDVGPGRV